MQEHALAVGEELVIGGGIRLTVLGVAGGEVLLGIAAPRAWRRGRTGGLPAAAPEDDQAGAMDE